MKVPLRWLSEFVDTGLTAEELAYRLTMAGLEAEKIAVIGETWDKIYVGYVEAVERHPDADRLVLATVDAGEHRLQVVTGAPNIAQGQKVALALAGARLIDGHADGQVYRTLKPSAIRGVRSEGMVCSEKELGLSDEHEGIMVLEAGRAGRGAAGRVAGRHGDRVRDHPESGPRLLDPRHRPRSRGADRPPGGDASRHSISAALRPVRPTS